MTKYARLVFEVEIPEDNTTNDEIEVLLMEHITEFLSTTRTITPCIEIVDTPYQKE